MENGLSLKKLVIIAVVVVYNKFNPNNNQNLYNPGKRERPARYVLI